MIVKTLFCVVLVASCGGLDAPTPTAPPSVQAAQSAAATGFTQVMESTTIAGQALARDERPIAMVFFASWCGHCRRELAELGELRKRYPTLRIIGLNAYEDFRDYSDSQRLQAYIAENAPWMTEIVTADESMREIFGNVPKIPTLFLYSSTGEVIAEYRRDKRPPPSAQELEQAIAQAVSAR